MRILVVGSGGREHALVWKLQRSRVERVFCAPGNGGIEPSDCVPIAPTAIHELKQWVKKQKIDLTVIGPEAPLDAGIIDEFEREQLPVFGPRRDAAQLEASKSFAKDVMKVYSISTAGAVVAHNIPEAYRKLEVRSHFPVVIKADGLAQGKGVTIARTLEEAKQAVDRMMKEKIFGDAGNKLLLEDYLEGEEVSFMAISDGETVVPLASSQDHKRAHEGDQGPNTGGMGAYSPCPFVEQAAMDKKILTEIAQPLVAGMKKQGISYRGVLYVGVMLTKTGPKVLEFNVRFGDPEIQAILPRLETDLVDVLKVAMTPAGLKNFPPPQWSSQYCVCVVLVSGGYPGPYKSGFPIVGLDQFAAGRNDVWIFHAGTKRDHDQIVTTGGRVLNVVALDATLEGAVGKANQACEQIQFENKFFRKDIGWRALRVMKQQGGFHA